MDPRVEKMADVLVNYSVGVQPGQWVVIQSPILGEPLALACMRAVLKAGGNPTVMFTSEDSAELLYTEGTEAQLSFVSPLAHVLAEQVDARISILAPRNTRALSAVPPENSVIVSKAHEGLLETSMRRTAEGTYHWNLAAHPTPAAAQDAGMSLRAYEDFVYGAGLLYEDDPVAAWRGLRDRQQRLIDWLRGKREVHVTAPGTDFRVSIEGRTWLNDDGGKNFPGGEIFTGPVEDSAEGEVSFTFPAFYGGRQVDGARLVFRAGRVVEASATTNEDYLHHMLDTDDGARRLGEFAFGSNAGIQTFTKNTLFDEKIGGTMHMALGRSYPETGGTNVSAIHWDMVCDLRQDAEIRVDGELFSKNGQFQI
jgi:aminopeptidase